MMYGKCGDLDSAEKLFCEASQRSVISWTAMISCYNQSSCFVEALSTFVEMQKSGVVLNSVSMVSVLHSCTQLQRLREGKSVHGLIIRIGMEFDLDFVGTPLMNLYASCRKLSYCLAVFETLKEKTVLSWNSLITGCTQNGYSEEALTFFVHMHHTGLSPDPFTLSSSLRACGHVVHLELGSQIHGHIATRGFLFDAYVQNCLIDMYCKCGLPDVACQIFNQTAKKDLITWNVMISGFSQNADSVKAIVLFDQMHSEGLEMDSITYLGVIQSCSNLGSLGKGRWAHHKLITSRLKKDTHIDSALITMYAKCGDIHVARKVFDRISEKTVVSWSSVISAYGLHGLANDAVLLFHKMIASGTRPNGVTFLGILSACGHAGFVEEGQFYFDLMRQEFLIEPQLDHFTCIVDLLSCAGHLDRALDFIKSMPIEANPSIWGAMLNGCRIHRRTDVADAIQSKIQEIEPQNSGYYVLLSNVYAEGGKLNEFGKVRTTMKNMGLRKAPGYSTIEIDKRVYIFTAGHTSHPQASKIYGLLEDLENLALHQGYAYMQDKTADILRLNKISKAEKCQKTR